MSTTTERQLLDAIRRLPHVTLDGLLEPGYTIRDLAFNLMANDKFTELFAAERRATVERIRARFVPVRDAGWSAGGMARELLAILDEEAAR